LVNQATFIHISSTATTTVMNGLKVDGLVKSPFHPSIPQGERIM